MPLAYRQAVGELLDEWALYERGLRRLPPTAEYLRGQIISFGMPVKDWTLKSLDRYLDRCLAEGRKPQSEKLLNALLSDVPLPRTQWQRHR